MTSAEYGIQVLPISCLW